ncbi:MAG TPA: response regulator [Steroidobacter sp.]|uniref:response regulator transcription factor n=1 Tax=Steroidobacter sp. TaxID=1978227 RepID=UPI002EDA5D83
METNTQWPRNATVYAIDDDDSFRHSILRMLTVAGLQSAGYASAGDFLIHRLKDERHAVPACILLDIAMPGPSGIELMKALASQESAPPIVFVTGRDDIYTSVDVMKCGAVDYLLKPVNSQRLLLSIARALRIDMERHAVRSERDELMRRMKLLTHEERLVFQGVVKHRLNKQMAVQLNVCERTVKTLRSRMMDKLQLNTVPELVRAETLIEMSQPEIKPSPLCPRIHSAIPAV